MEIRCPECGYSREVDAKNVDPELTVAVCPKCNSKFSFRSVEETESEFSLEAADAPVDPVKEAKDPVESFVKDTPESSITSSAQEVEQKQEAEEEQRTVRPEDLYPPSVHHTNVDDSSDVESNHEAPAQESEPEKLKMVYSDGTPVEEQASDFPQDVPWAEVKELGFFPAIRATIQGVLKKPSLFYEVMNKKGKFSIPFSFFILVSLVSILFETVWQASFGNPLFPTESVGGLTLDDLLSVMFISPLILVVYLVVTGAVLHGALKLTGGGSRGLGVTLRVLCYAAAADLFSIIPMIGPLVGGVWKLTVVLIGLKTAHGTTYTRVIPPVVVLVLALVSFVLYSLKSQGIM